MACASIFLSSDYQLKTARSQGKTCQSAHTWHTSGQDVIVKYHYTGNQLVEPLAYSMRGMQLCLSFFRKMSRCPSDGICYMEKVATIFQVCLRVAYALVVLLGILASYLSGEENRRFSDLKKRRLLFSITLKVWIIQIFFLYFPLRFGTLFIFGLNFRNY